MQRDQHLTPSHVSVGHDGEGAWDGTTTEAELLQKIAALQERDWLGDGEVADFFRHCRHQKLSMSQAIEHLAERLPHFRDPAQLAAVVGELTRHADAGRIVHRLVTPDLLRRVHRTR